MVTETIIAQRILVRDMPDRSRIVATLRIYQIGGNAHPHFSATADVFEPRGTWSGAACSRNGREPNACGCAHGELLRAFPGAVGFVRMHLSDYPSGRPMHAAANGRYHAEHGGAETAANLLRVDDVRDLPRDLDAETWEMFADAQADRWAAEARAAFELLAMMPDVTDLRGYDRGRNPIERRPLPAWLVGSDAETVDV